MNTSQKLKPQIKILQKQRGIYFHSDKDKYKDCVRRIKCLQKSLRLVSKHESNMAILTEIINNLTNVRVRNMFGILVSGNNRQTDEQELAKLLFCKAGIELAGVQGATVVRYMGGKTIQNHIKWRRKATKMIREHLYIKVMYNEIKMNYNGTTTEN